MSKSSISDIQTLTQSLATRTNVDATNIAELLSLLDMCKDVFGTPSNPDGVVSKKNLISIEFWRVDDEDVPYDLRETLEENGLRHANQMINEGYSEGELAESHDNVDYTGYWTLTRS